MKQTIAVIFLSAVTLCSLSAFSMPSAFADGWKIGQVSTNSDFVSDSAGWKIGQVSTNSDFVSDSAGWRIGQVSTNSDFVSDSAGWNIGN